MGITRKHVSFIIIFALLCVVGVFAYINTASQEKKVDDAMQIISGSFAIHNIETGKNLRPHNADVSNGNDIILYPHHKWKCLTWQFNHIEGTTYQLQNIYTQKTLEPKSTPEAGVALWQQPLNEESPQWEFIEQPDGTYAIRLKKTELYITVSSKKTNSAIVLMPHEHPNKQHWKLIEQYPRH
ncbi:RICIN domain-containing protein [Clostridium sp. JNZ X4-2]